MVYNQFPVISGYKIIESIRFSAWHVIVSNNLFYGFPVRNCVNYKVYTVTDFGLIQFPFGFSIGNYVNQEVYMLTGIGL